MGGNTNYDKLYAFSKMKRTMKTEEEKKIALAKQNGFPHCKGTFPDCPEKPEKEHPTCSNCPILQEDDWC